VKAAARTTIKQTTSTEHTADRAIVVKERTKDDRAAARRERLEATMPIERAVMLVPETSGSAISANSDSDSDLEEISIIHIAPTQRNSLEVILVSIQTYISGSIEAGEWIIKGDHPDILDLRSSSPAAAQSMKSQASDLYTTICHARNLFKGGDISGGGACLDRGFEQIRSVLIKPDPFTVWEILNTVSHLHEHGWPDVLDMLLTHLSKMAVLTYGHFHPMYRIFEHFRSVPYEDRLKFIALMRQCAADHVEAITGSESLSTLKLKLGWLRSVSLINSPESVEQRFRELLETHQRRCGTEGVRALLILNRLAKSLFERKRYVQTEGIGCEILRLATSQPLTRETLGFIGRGLSLMSRAQFVQGKYAAAEANLEKLLRFNVASYGWGDPLTIETITILEACLNSSEKGYTAAKVRSHRDRLIFVKCTTGKNGAVCCDHHCRTYESPDIGTRVNVAAFLEGYCN
jgi:hypothetical protein